MLARLGRPDEAASSLDLALAIDPTSAVVHAALDSLAAHAMAEVEEEQAVGGRW